MFLTHAIYPITSLRTCYMCIFTVWVRLFNSHSEKLGSVVRQLMVYITAVFGQNEYNIVHYQIVNVAME
jgi:hypothetical protein